MPRHSGSQPTNPFGLVDRLTASRAAIIAARFALPIERAALVATLALGVAVHG